MEKYYNIHLTLRADATSILSFNREKMKLIEEACRLCGKENVVWFERCENETTKELVIDIYYKERDLNPYEVLLKPIPQPPIKLTRQFVKEEY